MNAITYHEWCKHLRDAATIDRSAGNLSRVSAQSGIPVERLEQWLAKHISLSHTEFLSLHEVLAETHILGSESNDAANAEEPRATSDACRNTQRGCQSCEDSDLSFDDSN